MGKSLSRNQFHRDKIGIVFGKCIEDCDDIRMIQGHSDTRLAKESFARRGCHEPWFQRLECDETAQVEVPGFENFAHCAFADGFDDFEVANVHACCWFDHLRSWRVFGRAAGHVPASIECLRLSLDA